MSAKPRKITRHFAQVSITIEPDLKAWLVSYAPGQKRDHQLDRLEVDSGKVSWIKGRKTHKTRVRKRRRNSIPDSA